MTELDPDGQIGGDIHVSVEIELSDITVFAEAVCPGSIFGDLGIAEGYHAISLVKVGLTVCQR